MSRNVNTLGLLSLKIAPNVFDLSSGQHHVSIRDQIVRGQLLVRDLLAADPSANRFLVVGAGVAGVAAAMAIAAAGKSAYVLDTANEPFSLQLKATKRFVGPFMYEWPAPFHDKQSYPPDPPYWHAVPAHTPNWHAPRPLPANELAQQLTSWLKSNLPPSKLLRFFMGADGDEVKQLVIDFAKARATKNPLGSGYPGRKLFPDPITLSSKPLEEWPTGEFLDTPPLKPDYIILGAGLGQEVTAAPGSTYTGPAFWEDDDLRAHGTANENIVILGGGDGALQDLLRAVTDFDHPLDFIAALNGSAAGARIEKEIPHLAAAEQQSRLYATWTDDHVAFRHIDDTCRTLAEDMAGDDAIRGEVSRLVRPGQGQVDLLVREGHFTKTYLLNRLVAHLLLACSARGRHEANWSGRMRLTSWFHTYATEARPVQPLGHEVDYETLNPNKASPIAKGTLTCDRLVIRFGIDLKGTLAAQIVSVRGRRWKARTLHGRIPVPYVMPK